MMEQSKEEQFCFTHDSSVRGPGAGDDARKMSLFSSSLQNSTTDRSTRRIPLFPRDDLGQIYATT